MGGDSDSKSRTLSALSADVLVNIMSFIKPCDIICLRQTCKTFSSLTKLRTVWINAVRSVMVRYSVPAPLFPLEKATPPVLEHIALSPLRFASLLEKHNNVSVEPTCIRFLPSRVSREEQEKYGITQCGRFTDIFLAPGGRHLVTLSADGPPVSSVITLWDLGFGGNDMAKPIARYLEQTQGMVLDCITADPNRPDVLYLLSKMNVVSPVRRSRVLVHRIFLGNPPEISQCAVKDVPMNIVHRIYVIPGSGAVIVLYYHDGKFCFWIWDFLANEGALLLTPNCLPTAVVKLFAYDNCIMVALDDRILVFNMPPLTPFEQPLREYMPTIIIAPPYHSGQSFYINEIGSMSLSPSINGPRYILRVEQDALFLFEVRDNVPSTHSSMPNKLPMTLGAISLTGQAIRQIFHTASVRRFDDQFFFMQRRGDSLALLMLSPRLLSVQVRVPGIPLQVVNATLELSAPGEVVSVDYSPLLGRVCVQTEGNHVCVLDYLVPPED